MASSSKQTPKTQKATVEDDDDLDDLDDVLTQFKVPEKPAPVPPSASGSSTAAPGASETTLGDPEIPREISEEFEAGLEELLRQLSFPQSEPPAGSSSKDTPKSDPLAEDEDTKAFRKAWEQMMADGMSGVDDGKAPNEEYDKIIEKAMEGIFESQARLSAKRNEDSSATKSGSAGPSDPYQDAIKKTMEKLKSSDESNKAASAQNPDDAFADLLKQFGDPDGEDLPGGMENMIEDMLSALMSKEILYEPLKELRDQFPDYLKSHPDLPPEDKKRYQEQLRLSGEIVAVFDQPAYSDGNTIASGEILKLMTEMQSQGSPPAEILGSLPEGMGLDALTKGEGCIIS